MGRHYTPFYGVNGRNPAETRRPPPQKSQIATASSGSRVSVKDSYWRWPERNLAGNAIDFHVQILGLSFHDAMHLITAT